MIKWLTRNYNRWLFKKYGFDTGVFFDGVPKVYKWIPLWSPSLYRYYEGQKISEWFTADIENAVKAINDTINMNGSN